MYMVYTEMVSRTCTRMTHTWRSEGIFVGLVLFFFYICYGGWTQVLRLTDSAFTHLAVWWILTFAFIWVKTIAMCASSVTDICCILLVQWHYIKTKLYFAIKVRKQFMPHCVFKVCHSTSVSYFIIVCFFVTGLIVLAQISFQF